MNREPAKKLIRNTFESSFDEECFRKFIRNLLNSFEEVNKKPYTGNYIPESYRDYVKSLKRVGKYEDENSNKIDILVIKLKKTSSLERARTMQRNFIAWYLNGSRGGVLKDAALAAFVAPDEEEWRFSFVEMEYGLTKTEEGKTKAKKELTPARRYSFLVGINEGSHTAQSQFVPILEKESPPILEHFKQAFSVEKVTEEFYQKYRELFEKLKEELDRVIKNNEKIKKDFDEKNIKTENFAKKTLGQIVFLYFLQKKGWFGVERDKDWGTGSKNFLNELFEGEVTDYDNFFNDILEPLFYEALAVERTDDYYSHFDCKIPFLNGGLFDPIKNYDWVHTDIKLPNKVFSNDNQTEEGDTGDGILDVFNRYNFTVKEDEPLEKEVAIDPEMLGKVFENLLPENLRRGKGTYYTPREVVHYMCQDSLVNYLCSEINSEIKEEKAPSREEVEKLIKFGEGAVEHDKRVNEKEKQTETYSYKIPEKIRKNANFFDKKLANLRVCDPAVGSGAFLVGMMHEIVRTRNVLTNYLDKSQKKEKRTVYNFKLEAIYDSLYGVDIDSGAIEIAKLRLWLSLIVEEKSIKNIRPLPNLDYKIIKGNSLTRFPFEPQGLGEIEDLKDKLFDATSPAKKKKLRRETNKKIKELFDNTEENLGYKIDFDFKVQFSEVFRNKNGFDIAIANPPYGVRESKKLQEEYELCSKDSYGIFVALALKELLRKEGILTYITSDTWLTIKTHKKLRKQVLNKSLQKVIRLHRDAFNATVNACIFTVLNKKPNNNQLVAADFTNISTREEESKLREKLYNLRGFIEESTPKFAVYQYDQELIETNSNLPVFVASPKLFQLMNDTSCKKDTEEIEGERTEVRKIKFNGEEIKLVRLGNIADVVQGLATGDNDSYLYQAPESGSRYRNIENSQEYILTDEDLKYISGNEGVRQKVIEKGIHKSKDEENFDKDRWFDGRYIIPYDKGGKSDIESGWLPNYYVPTDYFIDWSTWAVNRMHTLTIADRKRENGKEDTIKPKHMNQRAAVFRNTDFYFRKGLTLSYTGVYAPNLRLNSRAVFDVGGSCIFPYINDYQVLGNFVSKVVKYCAKNYVDHTVNFQIDENKELPFLFTENDQIISLVEQIIQKQKEDLQYDYMSNEQRKIDRLIYEMYELNKEDIKEIETWYTRRYPKLADNTNIKNS